MQYTQRRFSTSAPFKPHSSPCAHLLRLIKRRPLLYILYFSPLFVFFLILLRPFTKNAPSHPPPLRIHSLPSFSPITPPPIQNITSAVIVAISPLDARDISTTITSLRQQLPTLPITVFHTYQTKQQAQQAANTHLNTTARPLLYNRPYESVLLPLTSSNTQPPLYILAGTQLAPQALRWLITARNAYAARPDVAAFFLDGAAVRVKARPGADHDNTVWKETVVSGDAFLYQLCVGGAAFVPNWAGHMDVWGTFAEWLRLRRADWYRYPEGGGVDGTPLGMSALVERNWTRAAWNVWFSKFMTEYGLYAVYPGKVMARHGRMDFGRDMKLGELFEGNGTFDIPIEAQRFKGNGELGGEGKFAAVGDIVELGRRQGGVVSFTMVNKVFMDTAKSWLCNVDVAGFRPRGLVWAVTDAETKEALQRVEGTAVVLLDEVKGGKETGHEFGNPGYWKLMLERTELIGEILRNGVAVFAFETDAIWLEDPEPYINELVQQDADIVGTINTRMEVSGNFFYLRPTLATRRLWDEIVTQFDRAFKNAHFEKKEASSWTYIENDQSLLTKLVLRNETWRRSYPLSFLTLDMERFVDGRWYTPEEGFYTSKRAREPVVINNNFVIGIEEKTARAKKWGHWFWDEKEEKCLDGVVGKAVRQGRKASNSEILVDGHDGAHAPRSGS